MVKGKLLLVGGGEYRGEVKTEGTTERPEADDREKGRVLECLFPDRESAHIEIITSGTSYPRESFEQYEKFFKDAGVKEVGMLDIDSRNIKSEHLRRIEKASAIFISGGNQRKILEVIGGSRVEDVFLNRMAHDPDFILGGTSAGAMVMSEITIGDGFRREKMMKGDVDMRPGMKVLPGTIIDTHFLKSMRLTRLALAVLNNPEFIGIGLPENTGVLVTDGHILECVGAEMALLVDASKVDPSVMNNARERDAVSVEGLAVHFLNEGGRYCLKQKKFLS